MRLKFTFMLIFVFYASLTYSQSSNEIRQNLDAAGIKTEADLVSELESRGISETQARQLATQYGITYEEFISQYLKDQNVISPKVIAVKDTLKGIDNSLILGTDKDYNYQNDRNKIPTSSEATITGKYFGYNIFKNIPKSFEPLSIGPVDPGYIIGPGDMLRIYLWGDVEFQYELTVDSQGNIFIPTAGQVFVSGISYSDLMSKLTRYLSKFYEGLSADPPSVFLDVSLARLRPIKVFALGEIAFPGGYNISSFANVFNALYSIGGPLTSGSLREIRILRNNKILTKIDIYDYLLKGNLIGDVRLQNNDVIFIPPRLNSIEAEGEILHPGIYELRSNEGVKDLIKFAGGLKPTSYTGRIQISRIIPFNERYESKLDKKLIDLDLGKILKDGDKDFKLVDGDVITISPILERLHDYVKIEGAVYRPGTFAITEAQNLFELISKSDGLLPEAFEGKADIIRTRPDNTNEFISVNLSEVMTGNQQSNIQLKPRDLIKIYSIYDLSDKQSISISGYVKNPFTMLYADNITLYDIIFKAGGLQDSVFKNKAYLPRGDLVRYNQDGITTKIIAFNVAKVLGKEIEPIQLEPGDKIFIYKRNVEDVIDLFVRVEGEIRNPGEYALDVNMSPMDLILRAGGFTEQALRSNVYVNRINPNGYPNNQISETIDITLPTDFSFDTEQRSFLLQHKDVVVVRKNPEYEFQRFVKITGEVKYPGVYVLKKKNETIVNLLKESGGPTSEAYLYGSQFYRGNKRLVLDLEQLYYDGDDDEKIYLRGNDSVYIPKKSNTVFVNGEVNNPGLFAFADGYDVFDYIDKAGGVTDSADYIIYHKPNGESQKVGFGLFHSDPEVFDGSTIFVKKVPPPLPSERFDISAFLKDVLSITASVVTIVVLATKLN